MRKSLLSLAISSAMIFLAPLAAAQTSAAHHGKISRAFRFIGRHAKETWTDMRHDPLWAAYVAGTLAINFADSSSMCKARSVGILEADPFLGSRPSCARLTSTTALVTLVQTGSVHMLREAFWNSCKRDAADPNSKYNAISKKLGVSNNPERCRQAMDIVPMTEWPLHIQIIRGNIDRIEAQR